MLSHKELTIGQRFKQFRLQAGMSQAEVAEEICSIAVVSHLETDRNIPSANTLGKLAERLCVPLREIMGEDEKSMNVSFQVDVVRVYTERGDYPHALSLIEILGQRVDLLAHQRTELLVCKADCIIKLKRYSEGISLLMPFLEAQQIQQTVEDETLCELYNKLGNAHYRSNDFEKAYSAFEQGYRISLKLPVFGLVAARVTKNLGLTCNQVGLKEDARRFLEKAYAFYESASDTKGIANTLFDLAVATGDLELIKTARFMYESMNLVVEANLAKLHYAYFIEAKRNLATAVEDFDNTSLAFEEIGDLGLAVYTKSRAAMACIEQNDLEHAKRFLVEAETVLEQMDKIDDLQCADFYKARAQFRSKTGDFQESIGDSLTSSDMYARMGLYSESADALQISSEVYSKQGLHESAYQVSLKVIELLRKYSQGGLM